MGWSKFVRNIAKPIIHATRQNVGDFGIGFLGRVKKDRKRLAAEDTAVTKSKIANAITGQQAQTDAWGAEPTSVPEN